MVDSYSKHVLKEWHQFVRRLADGQPVNLDGKSLTLESVVAVSRYGSPAGISQCTEVATQMEASVKLLHQRVSQHESIYGVTTGFGGSANTRTSQPRALQQALLQMQHSAVLPVPIERMDSTSADNLSSLPSSSEYSKLCMPAIWVKAAILVRCNALLRGHSAVRLEVVETLLKLLDHEIIPLVPLRGSISASGDLCPLSYVAGVLEGNPDIMVWTGDRASRSPKPANIALAEAGISCIQFGPKETLGVLNGTAFSVAVASLAQHEVDTLAVFAQVLTAMGVEALMGSAESFHPIFSRVRPHRGQTDVSSNIRMFLRGSKLTSDNKNSEDTGADLRQDRYPLRTSAQWIGPFIEDMELAREQLQIELNSTTDNPLVDIASGSTLHGGNFQATAVTSATEKTRTALEKIGKMIFAQSTELLDERLTYNLPPNLAVDEPSLSYTMKGVDINMAAYMSELAFLANPVSNHVQSAEMCNQALNSLALISARYTHTAVDIVSLMLSAYLYSLCQAIDLRAMNERFMDRLRPGVNRLTIEMFGNCLDHDALGMLKRAIQSSIAKNLAITTTMDSSDRFLQVAQATQQHVVSALHEFTITKPSTDPLELISTWTLRTATLIKNIFCSNRIEYLASPDASEYLGLASKRMYNYVRQELKVPMHRGLIDHPTVVSGECASAKKTTGTQVSIIYQALRQERLTVPIMACLQDAIELREKEHVILAKL